MDHLVGNHGLSRFHWDTAETRLRTCAASESQERPPTGNPAGIPAEGTNTLIHHGRTISPFLQSESKTRQEWTAEIRQWDEVDLIGHIYTQHAFRARGASPAARRKTLRTAHA